LILAVASWTGPIPSVGEPNWIDCSIPEVVSTSCNFSDLLRVLASVSRSCLELPI
jgi:hypothetical protein